MARVVRVVRVLPVLRVLRAMRAGEALGHAPPRVRAHGAPQSLPAQVAAYAERWAVTVAAIRAALQVPDATALVGAVAVIGIAGVLGVALRFAFKDTLENYLVGILMSLRQPFRAARTRRHCLQRRARNFNDLARRHPADAGLPRADHRAHGRRVASHSSCAATRLHAVRGGHPSPSTTSATSATSASRSRTNLARPAAKTCWTPVRRKSRPAKRAAAQRHTR